MKRAKLLSIILILTFIMGSLCACDAATSSEVKKVEPTESASEDNISEEDKELIFSKGDTASQDDIQITFNKVKESKGGDFNKPAKGKIFVQAEFLVENKSDKEIIISALSYDAYADGYAVNDSVGAMLNNDILSGSVAPGKKLKGILGFEVDKKYKELEVDFKLSLLNPDNKIKFVYKKK